MTARSTAIQCATALGRGLRTNASPLHEASGTRGAVVAEKLKAVVSDNHLVRRRGLSDFTAMGTLCVTIAGAAFAHILHRFVLAFSRWEHVEAMEGGESLRIVFSNALFPQPWRREHGPRRQRVGL